MKLATLRDKMALETFFRADAFLHIYSIGDLDDRFWPHTVWYGLEDGGLREVALLYTRPDPPVLIALTPRPIAAMRRLLRVLEQVLPRRFYAHLSPGLPEELARARRVRSHGRFHKMGLVDRRRAASTDGTGAVRLAPADEAELLAFYRESYPGHWFDPWMLETGCYHGVREAGRLASVAGVHVYSPRYRVAALGNIATRPASRGRGLATRACAALCADLLPRVDHIGLNVHSENEAAIACYRKLGFEVVAGFEECSIEPLAVDRGA